MRLTKNQIKEIEQQVQNYPMPSQMDIDRAKIAAMTCDNIQEIANFLEIDLVTFKVWVNKSKSFYAAINSWETMATLNIKKALAKRAIGFTKTTHRDVVTKAGNVETLAVETYYPPSETAGAFWLKNKAAEEFQDKKEIDVNVNANIRAWLVQAGGQLDPSETIDISPGSLIANEAAALTNNEINNIIINELEDNIQANLEAELITDLIAEAEASPVQAAPTVELENNSPVSPDDGARPAWQALNSKWS
jgi:hypothetical protein